MIENHGTPALARGDAMLRSCKACGSVIYVPGRGKQTLGPCPVCAHSTWYAVTLPVAGFVEVPDA